MSRMSSDITITGPNAPIISDMLDKIEDFFKSINMIASHTRIRTGPQTTEFEVRLGNGIWSDSEQKSVHDWLLNWLGNDIQSLSFDDFEIEWDNDRTWPQAVRFYTHTKF